jgi:hypothetical protein
MILLLPLQDVDYTSGYPGRCPGLTDAALSGRFQTAQHGIIFTGVAISVSPFVSRCEISQTSPKLQGFSKISTKKKENRGVF